MKRPIELDGGNLSSIITMMLMEQGKDRYSLTFEQFNTADLGDKCLYCEGEWAEGNENNPYPDSISVVIMTMDELEAAGLN